MTMFPLSPSQIRKRVVKCMEAQLVPFIQSSPGLGKSNIVAQIAEDFGLELIDLRLSQCAPEDLMGLPMRNGEFATFAPFEMFPTTKTKIPAGKEGWILFLDEFNSASKSVQAAAYKLALDRMVGQAKLHDNCFVVAAGNLATDRAIVNQLSTAMQSRVVHLEMVASKDDFMAHAVKAGFDHRILAFLEFQPSKLHNFKPDHTDKTFACPRTWEFASRLIKGVPEKDVDLPLLAGTISEGIATEFHTFLKVYTQVPRFADICAAPESITVPTEPGTRYAVISLMLDHLTVPRFDDVVKYALRFEPEFQVIFFRGVAARFPELRDNKTFNDNIMHLVRFLNDDDAQLAA